MSITIRRAVETDEPALLRICLLTGDAGNSAEHLHDYPELPGLVYAAPYVKLPTTWGFVMIDESTNETVGYILGSKDTRVYEEYAARHWWPKLAEKYPPSLAKKPDDERYMKLLSDMPPPASEACVAFAAAHLHIDILGAYQGRGWGRRLMTTAIEYLKGEGVEGEGVWLGLDPRNVNARRFYERLGFKSIQGAADNYMGIKFSEYK